MSVVCGKPCPYNTSNFCGKGITILNELGICAEWFDKNGQPKMFTEPGKGMYRPSDTAAYKQEPPHQENMEENPTSAKTQDETENVKNDDRTVGEHSTSETVLPEDPLAAGSSEI